MALSVVAIFFSTLPLFANAIFLDDDKRFLCCALNCCECQKLLGGIISIPSGPFRDQLCKTLKCCVSVSPTAMSTTAPTTTAPTLAPTPTPTTCCGIDDTNENGTALFDSFASREDLEIAIVNWTTVADRANVRAMYGPPNCWDVSAITNMDELFKRVEFFEAPDKFAESDGFSCWDVSNVVSMKDMFYESNFPEGDGDGLGQWDVSQVTDFSGMFYDVNTFGGDGLGAWDVSNAMNFTWMFAEAGSFATNLCPWYGKIRNDADLSGMLNNSNCPFTILDMNVTFCTAC